MQDLRAAGFVTSTRGHGGGHCLARPAKEISVADVISALEPVALVACLRANDHCVLAPSCRLSGALSRAYEAFLETLRELTIADISTPAVAKLIRLGERHEAMS